MPIVKMPNGIQVMFPDDVSQEQLKGMVGQAWQKIQDEPDKFSDLRQDTTSPSSWDEFKRGFGVGVRNIMEGVGDIPDTFLNQPINAVGKFFGYDLGLSNPGTGLADAMGLPKAKTDTEKLVSAGVRGAAGVLPTLAAGAAPAVAKAAPTVAGLLSAAPKTQIVSGATGAMASEAARQGGGGTGAQIAAGLVGGMAPGIVSPLAVGAGRSAKGAARALSALSDDGQRQIAAENLRAYSSDPDSLLTRLNDARGEIVPGSAPTLGQTLGDPGLSVAEKGRANRGPAGAQFGERYRNQREARQAELEDLAAGVADRMAGQETGVNAQLGRMQPMGYADTPEAFGGGALRDVFDERYAAQKAQTRAAYDAIDPDNVTAFPLEALRNSLMDAMPQGQFAAQVPAEIRRFMAQIDDAIANGRTATYRDLQDIRTQLTDLSAQAANSGDAALNRIATGMKTRLDQFLESSFEQAEPVRPLPGSQAYRAAQAEARSVSGSDPWYDDLKYMYEQGISRDWLESQFGSDAVTQLNSLYPGLVRRNGKFIPDVSSADLQTMNVRNDGQALYEMLLDRLPYRQNARERQATALEQMLDASAVQPRGFTREQAEAFRKAKQTRKEQGQLFEQGYNTRMSRGRVPSGLADGDVLRNYFRSGPKGYDAALDFMRAFQGSDEAMSIMTDHIVQRFRQAAGKNGALQSSRMREFLKQHNDALTLFPELRQQLEDVTERQARLEATRDAAGKLYRRRQDGSAKLTGTPVDKAADAAALDPTEITRFRALQDDIARNNRMEELSAVRGSPTAQNLATQAIMDTVLGRSLGRNPNGLGTTPRGILRNMASGLVNRGVGLLYGQADERINELIDQAFLNPEFAKDILKNYKSYTPKVNLADVFKDSAKGTTLQTLRGLLGQFAQ